MTPERMPSATMCARSPVPSLRAMRARWLFTVSADRSTFSPISLFVYPSATSRRMSRSRADSSPTASSTPVWVSPWARLLAIPGSANFAGEFLILLGVFNAKLAIALIASTGVILASVYMLRTYIRAVHNRVGERVRSRDMSGRDAIVLVPLVLAILAFALYPQPALRDSEATVKRVVAVPAGGEAVAQREATP